jgi:NAD(P)-dependent dehydrogenase (short-subunit alcohol dehydrogenase family)
MPNALITGGSTGFGAGTLAALRSRGWTAYGTSRRPDAAPADDTPLLPLDLRDDASIAALGEFVRGLDDGLGALVSNAGIAVNGPWEELSSAELRQQLEVNLIGTMAVVRECLPALRRSGGVIVQVTSISGLIGDAGFGAYNASKFGLEGATEALVQEVRGQGIRVVLVEPGPFLTPIVDAGDEIAGRDDSGRYAEVWRGLEEWRTWFRGNAEDPRHVVAAIVGAIERDDAPFRIPVGSKVPQWIREHTQRLLDDVDAAQRFLASLESAGD